MEPPIIWSFSTTFDQHWHIYLRNIEGIIMIDLSTVRKITKPEQRCTVLPFMMCLKSIVCTQPLDMPVYFVSFCNRKIVPDTWLGFHHDHRDNLQYINDIFESQSLALSRSTIHLIWITNRGMPSHYAMWIIIMMPDLPVTAVSSSTHHWHHSTWHFQNSKLPLPERERLPLRLPQWEPAGAWVRVRRHARHDSDELKIKKQ